MRAFLFALWLSATGWASAQNITGYEYWFDTNDANPNRTLVDVTDAQTINLPNESIVLGTLPVGHHKIHYRLKDSNGRWSSVISKPFMRLLGGTNEIVSGEYWFDLNHEDRQPFQIGPGQVVNVVTDFPTTGLGNGPHTIRYRLRDTFGQWSSVLSKPFTVNPGGPHLLVQFRYWTDQAPQDPVDMHYVPVDPQVQYLDLNTAIAFCASTVQGAQPLYFQIQDNHGFWSSVVTRVGDVTFDGFSAEPVTPSISQQPNEAVEPDSTYIFTATAYGANQFDWTFPSGWTLVDSTATTITAISPGEPSSGTVFCTGTNVCGSGATGSLPFSGMNVHSALPGSDISLFPNPTTGLFTVTLPGGYVTSHLLVLNSLGQMVRDVQPAQSDRYNLDLSNEASGLYTVRILQGEQHTKLQVMVQH